MSTLPFLTVLSLARACAPQVAPETLLSVVRVESGFDPLTIGVNGRPRATVRPTSPADALAQARALIAEGRDIDLGLAQLNVRNLAALHLSLRDAFDPCRSLQGGATVLAGFYARRARRPSNPQAALTAALSAYNTGDPARGLRNGYVAKVRLAAAQVVPALARAGPIEAAPVRSDPLRPAAASADPAPAKSPVSLDVFAGRGGVLVWAPAAGPVDRPPPASPSPQQPGDPS